MKRILPLIFALAYATPVGAAQHMDVDHVLKAVTVASTGNVLTTDISMLRVSSIVALGVLATSVAGTTDIKIEYELSYDGDVYTATSDFADIIGSTAASCPAAELTCVVSLPPAMGFAPVLRLRVTGLATNAADTKVSLWLVTTKN